MNETSKETTSQKMSDFIVKKKKALLASLVIVIAVIVVVGVMSITMNQKNVEVMNATTKLFDLAEDLATSEDKDSKEFEEYAAKLISDYKGTKAELLSYTRLASYYFDEGKFQEALDNYTLAYTNFPDDIATSVNIFNAAMANEELGNIDETIKLLELIVEKYKSSTPEGKDLSSDVPEAIFNLGRIYEGKDDIEKASSYYDILVTEYNSYQLAGLAKSRLIDIK